MPELPEVEIVCRNLQELIRPPQVLTDWVFYRKDLRFSIPKKSLQALKNQKLLGISRRAKYILLEFAEDFVVSHLGMTGSWREEKMGWVPLVHDHVALILNDRRVFVYHDPRRFGFIEVVKKNKIKLRFENLGVEPLSIETDYVALSERLKNLATPIKSAIMNQKYIVGVGNIYASEALFKAGVSPLRSCVKVTRKEYINLWLSVQQVLAQAIQKGGSTIENYKNAYGEAGAFQKEFFVYGRAGEVCLKCDKLIRQKTISGRNSFWCPSCQK